MKQGPLNPPRPRRKTVPKPKLTSQTALVPSITEGTAIAPATYSAQTQKSNESSKEPKEPKRRRYQSAQKPSPIIRCTVCFKMDVPLMKGGRESLQLNCSTRGWQRQQDFAENALMLERRMTQFPNCLENRLFHHTIPLQFLSLIPRSLWWHHLQAHPRESNRWSVHCSVNSISSFTFGSPSHCISRCSKITLFIPDAPQVHAF